MAKFKIIEFIGDGLEQNFLKNLLLKNAGMKIDSVSLEHSARRLIVLYFKTHTWHEKF